MNALMVKNIKLKSAVLPALTLLVSLFSVLPAGARTINVRGSVVRQGTHEPLEGVTIRNADTDHLIGTTNMEGKFTVSVEDNGNLLFSVMGSEDLTVPVDGQLNMEVALFPKAHELDEVVVVAKGVSNALVIEPAELDVKGNYIYLKKHVKIPHKLFSSSVRMIIQPTIYNVTERHLYYLKPVVFDGHRYAITQRRMYDWDEKLDSLTQYRTVKRTSRRTDDVVLISDSLYVKSPKDDFMCVVFSSMENYNNIVYADTFMIARGTVNPLRFLNYSLKGYEMTDERFLPQPEVFLRDSEGDMNLVFEVGKSNLNLSLGDNASEIDAMLGEFRSIENDPDMTLKSFTISGTASPEGSYDKNLKLANARMQSAMDVIMQSVPENLRRGAKMSTDASVARWTEVEELLRKDGHNAEADAVAEVIAAYPGSIDSQSARMRRLPFYKSLLVDEYLPRLRKVSYEIVTSRYRPLTDEEIAVMYHTDNSQLSKYNFWRYYKGLDDVAAKEDVMRKALEVHPDFLAAATDLSALLINNGKADQSVLDPFFTDPKTWLKMPENSRFDMAVSAMNEMHFSLADSLMFDLPDTPEFHKGKAYCAALNGRYVDVMQEISEDSPLNEVLLLLALKDNDTAWERAQKLGDTAIEEYIKATAANRVDSYLDAVVHLENALRLDPSLRDVARVDGDLTDLLEDVLEELDDNGDNGDNANE